MLLTVMLCCVKIFGKLTLSHVRTSSPKAKYAKKNQFRPNCRYCVFTLWGRFADTAFLLGTAQLVQHAKHPHTMKKINVYDQSAIRNLHIKSNLSNQQHAPSKKI